MAPVGSLRPASGLKVALRRDDVHHGRAQHVCAGGWVVVHEGYVYRPGYWAAPHDRPRYRYYRTYPPPIRGPRYRVRRR